MDQVKIGQFIAACRKQAKLTQEKLAEKLGITDRAVSKWETGRALPDSSAMLPLCRILGITVNDLLHGERVTMEKFDHQAEEQLLELVRQKQQADKRLLRAEIFIGAMSTAFLFGAVFAAAFLSMPTWARIVLIAASFAVFLAGCFYALRIEQVAGYYECKHCGHRYVPTFKAVCMAQHMGRARYMRCPKCGQKSWQKKVIGKE